MADDAPRKEHFEEAYEGKPPWDTGKPQPVFVQAADLVKSPVLDVGCGTGENALFFAERGHQVTGVDYVETAINLACEKASKRNVPITFLVMDALRLDNLPHKFHSAIDSGLFHVFDDVNRARYVENLTNVVEQDGRLFLLCFSENEPPGDGPRRVTRQELHDAFADGWEVESIEPARFEVRPDLVDIHFSEGGPHAWFAILRRT